MRWGSRCAPQSQVLTWGPSCSHTPSFCPARDPKHWNSFVRVDSGNSLAAHMAYGAMHKTRRHTRGTQPPVTIIGLTFPHPLSHAAVHGGGIGARILLCSDNFNCILQSFLQSKCWSSADFKRRYGLVCAVEATAC